MYLDHGRSGLQIKYISRPWELWVIDYVSRPWELRVTDYITGPWELWVIDYVSRPWELRVTDFASRPSIGAAGYRLCFSTIEMRVLTTVSDTAFFVNPHLCL